MYFVFDDLILAEYNNDEDANEDDVRAEVFDRVPSSVELEYFETILESPVYLILETHQMKGGDKNSTNIIIINSKSKTMILEFKY